MVPFRVLSYFVLEFIPLRGEKNFKPRLQNMILVPLRGSFQNFQQATRRSDMGIPPPKLGLNPHFCAETFICKRVFLTCSLSCKSNSFPTQKALIEDSRTLLHRCEGEQASRNENIGHYNPSNIFASAICLNTSRDRIFPCFKLGNVREYSPIFKTVCVEKKI